MEEGVLSATEKQSMVSSFLEIAFGQSADTAKQYLQATSWKLEEAIQLFFVVDEGGPIVASSQSPASENVNYLADQNTGMGYLSREARSSSSIACRNFDEEMKRPGVWESDQGSSYHQDNLASLYRPPYHLMLHGSFEKAKDTASLHNKWLLVNLQSTKEFTSHMLNRDTWSNQVVSLIIKANFFFWQEYDDTTEGRKVCTYYELDSMPVVLLIDPITGQKMCSWYGMVHPEQLLEDLLPFMDGKRPRESYLTPRSKANKEDEEMILALGASVEGMKLTMTKDSSGMIAKDKDITVTEEEKACSKKLAYPPLPEEPKGDRNLLCRVGFHLPDGRLLQRNFFRTDSIQLLWSFCYSLLEQAETRPFRLTHESPGPSRSLDYDSQSTFEESGLANSMISITWDEEDFVWEWD
ncbi:plant UBX domain-containing protein 7-like [Quercus robur]|uniref:plant UBX domain-containing protein 7-like n=1 Tax=Quercus robur TaxID=38942 RepID=UPI0021620503|nr:plant UBX domain-containing protein 7-like [Quercus robur]